MAIERKLIQIKGTYRPTVLAGLEELREAFVDGWVIDEDAKGVKTAPVFSPRLTRIPLKREVLEEIEIAPESDEEKESRLVVAALNSDKAAKEEWLWLAERKGVSITPDVTNPLQIRKLIKEALQSE